MAVRKALVQIAGTISELPTGDTLLGASGLTDGDKGDIIVSGTGTVLTIDPAAKFGIPMALSQNVYSN